MIADLLIIESSHVTHDGARRPLLSAGDLIVDSVKRQVGQDFQLFYVCFSASN